MNFSLTAIFHLKTSACLKYFVSDCSVASSLASGKIFSISFDVWLLQELSKYVSNLKTNYFLSNFLPGSWFLCYQNKLLYCTGSSGGTKFGMKCVSFVVRWGILGPYIKYVGGGPEGFCGAMKYFRHILRGHEIFFKILMGHKIFSYVLFS